MYMSLKLEMILYMETQLMWSPQADRLNQTISLPSNQECEYQIIDAAAND